MCSTASLGVYHHHTPLQCHGRYSRRGLSLCCSSARRETCFSAPPEPPKQPISVTQDFRHPRSEADSLGAAGRSLERKSPFLAHPPPRSRQALTVQKERRGVREEFSLGPRAGWPRAPEGILFVYERKVKVKDGRFLVERQPN